MTEIDLSRAEWRKSTYSSQDGNCVEVARNLSELVMVRDSRQPDVEKLVISPAAWLLFIKNVRTWQSRPDRLLSPREVA